MAKKISTATLNFNELCRSFLKTKEEKKNVVTKYESIRKEIIDLLGINNTRNTLEYTVVYSSQERDTFDLNKFKTDHPDMYLAYLKKTEAWTLTVTKKETLKRKKGK